MKLANFDVSIAELVLGAILHDIGKPVQRADSNPRSKNHSLFGADKFQEIINGTNTDSSSKLYTKLQAIKESIKKHHASMIRDAGHFTESNSNYEFSPLFWLVFEADNIAAAHDREELKNLIDEDGFKLMETDENVKNKFDQYRRLNSPFTYLKRPKINSEESKKIFYDLWYNTNKSKNRFDLSNQLDYPYPEHNPQESFNSNAKSKYEEITSIIEKNVLKTLIDFYQDETVKKNQYSELCKVNYIIKQLEELLSYVPPDTYTGNVNDVSLYDHLKLTAAVASCLYYYLINNEDKNWYLNTNLSKTNYRECPAYRLVKIDLSGIQDFIYSISTKYALKALRAKSLYLELILQIFSEQILENFELSIANLLYLGGGGAILLLPNLEDVDIKLKKIENAMNLWLYEKFRTKLHISIGSSELKGEDLRTHDEDNNSALSDAWSKISKQISKNKAQKFKFMIDSGEIFNYAFNDKNQAKYECSVCQIEFSEDELKNLDDNNTDESDKACSNCRSFFNLGAEVIRSSYTDKIYALSKEKDSDKLLALPKLELNEDSFTIDNIYLKPVPKSNKENSNIDNLEKINNFVFHNNHNYLHPVINCSLAVATDENHWIKSFEQLVENKVEDKVHYKKIAVLRADIDNLGKLFTGQKLDDDEATKIFGWQSNSLRSLSRDAMLSRSLGKFFTHYLDKILDEYQKHISVVYAGGDDLFLVGAWDTVIEAAIKIAKKFSDYSTNSLTLSAGISIHNHKYPLYRMAQSSEQAEKVAKKNHGKNSLCVFFDDGIFRENNSSHCFKWSEWDTIIQHIKELDNLNLSTALIYELLLICKELLNNSSSKAFPIHRLYYRLARYEDDNFSDNSEYNQNTEKNQWIEFKANITEIFESYALRLGDFTNVSLKLKYYETAMNYYLLSQRDSEAIKQMY